MRVGGSPFGPGTAVFLCLLMVFASTACTWFTGKGKPGWVDGRSAEYPLTQYLTGIGQADTRSNAEDQAYAAVARIFKAKVAAQAKDWESYLVVENLQVTIQDASLASEFVIMILASASPGKMTQLNGTDSADAGVICRPTSSASQTPVK